MNSSKDASDIGDLLSFRKDTFRLFPRAGRGAVASWPFVRKSRQNWTNSRNGGQVIFRPAPKIAGPCNPCLSHDLRHSDRSAFGWPLPSSCSWPDSWPHLRSKTNELSARRVGVPVCFSCTFWAARRIQCTFIFQRSRPCRLDREPSRPIELRSSQDSQPASRCSQPRSPF